MSPTPAVAREPHTVRTSASLAARERAKESLRAQLRAVARRHIAERGAADLSVRAVARELNMTSSAVYRLISSRDELFTSLIVESYASLAEVAEQADLIQAGRGQDAAARWLAICRAVRAWALGHPHEYSLLYGSPIPGYLGPMDMAQGSTRIWRVVAGVMDMAISTGVLRPQARTFDVDGLVSPYVLATVGQPAPPFTDSILRGIALFSSLIGGISAELFGHFHGLTTDPDRVFDLVVATGAQGAGLELPVSYVDVAKSPNVRTTVD
jgi:AcrR family transcriptional regulator